ncbi:MAG: AsnC family transcriptional regulator [Bacteroides sp.]|nr:AsnC family transcriptional regulator [Bacteroides sp.]
MENYQLDKMDEVILRMLSENARVPFLEVARACGVSGTAIHQRVARLNAMGVLQGTEYKIDPTKIGYETCAYIGLYLKEDVPFDKAVEALDQIPEVVECHCTNEPFDFFIKVHARNNDHLLTIIHEKLKPVGLSHSKIILSFRQIIKKQLTVLPIEGKENVT